jgi:hypothetical protein
MTPIRLRPRKPKFRCAYCKHVGTAKTIEKHEKICFYNPHRHCELCNDLGYYGNGYDEPRVPCYYCSQFKSPRRDAVTATPAPSTQIEALSPDELTSPAPRVIETQGTLTV